jgi:hypothetical protein
MGMPCRRGHKGQGDAIRYFYLHGVTRRAHVHVSSCCTSKLVPVPCACAMSLLRIFICTRLSQPLPPSAPFHSPSHLWHPPTTSAPRAPTGWAARGGCRARTRC